MRDLLDRGTTIIVSMAILFFAVADASGQRAGDNRFESFWGTEYRVAASAGRTAALNGGPQGENPLARLVYWNRVSIDASGLDHTPVAPGENRVFGEQIGPGRASRAVAIVHIAIFEAMNSISGGYMSYAGVPRTRTPASTDAAIAKAAAETLRAMFPSQGPRIQQLLDEDLNRLPAGPTRENGVAVGQNAAAIVLALRAGDGAGHPEPRVYVDYMPNSRMGAWQQDPISRIPLALGAHWGEVQPFVLASASQFRVPPPPAMNSPEYAIAYNEVKRLGGDGTTTPTERTAEQTLIGIYWAYDGTPSLCAPPRLYNQITVQIAAQMGSNAIQTARLLALANTAMADAGIASWESKYYYAVWRPIGGIRGADFGWSPYGLGDGNPDTIGDPNFSPLGAPASNLLGPNFTPPFPAYPSGHAVFGGALFQTLRNFYGTDNIPFTFVSDELNGETLDNNGTVRPLVPRSFANFSQAEEENGQSRIYLGIHWSFDKTEGIIQGRRIADHVFTNAFRPSKNR